MTSILYEDIFVKFLGNIQDYDIPNMDEDDVEELMTEYLHKSFSKTYIRQIFQNSSLDDETSTLSFEMKQATDEQQDSDFVSYILAKAMVVEWLSPQVRSKLNIAQLLTGNEQKYYSQANHLNELRELLSDTKIELEKEISDRAFVYNAYLQGGTNGT